MNCLQAHDDGSPGPGPLRSRWDSRRASGNMAEDTTTRKEKGEKGLS